MEAKFLVAVALFCRSIFERFINRFQATTEAVCSIYQGKDTIALLPNSRPYLMWKTLIFSLLGPPYIIVVFSPFASCLFALALSLASCCHVKNLTYNCTIYKVRQPQYLVQGSERG